MKNNGLIRTSFLVRFINPGSGLILRENESVFKGVQRIPSPPGEDLLLLIERK